MALETETLVIRIRRPRLRRLLWIGVLVLLPLLFFLIYEFGRKEGGYDRSSRLRVGHGGGHYGRARMPRVSAPRSP